MNGFLTRLAERALGRAAVARPRIPARFEGEKGVAGPEAGGFGGGGFEEASFDRAPMHDSMDGGVRLPSRPAPLPPGPENPKTDGDGPRPAIAAAADRAARTETPSEIRPSPRPDTPRPDASPPHPAPPTHPPPQGARTVTLPDRPPVTPNPAPPRPDAPAAARPPSGDSPNNGGEDSGADPIAPAAAGIPSVEPAANRRNAGERNPGPAAIAAPADGTGDRVEQKKPFIGHREQHPGAGLGPLPAEWPSSPRAEARKHAAAAPAAEPTIKVTIGRIDVRALTPPPPQTRPSRAPAAAAKRLSFEDYLKNRGGGRI